MFRLKAEATGKKAERRRKLRTGGRSRDPSQRAGDRRRDRDACARDEGEVGRAHRERRRVDLSAGPALAGVAQDQARSRNRSSSSAAGPSRGRRGSTSARCCSASTRTDRPEVRRPHRHRVRSEGARARVEAPEGARDEDVAVLREDQDQRAGPLGPSRSGRADPLHGVDGGRASSGIRSISGCATTRARGKWSEKVPTVLRCEATGLLRVLRATAC